MTLARKLESAIRNSRFNIFRKQEDFSDLSDFHRQTYADVESLTMTTPHRIFAFIDAVEHVIHAGVSGAIVECGVWKGGSMMAAAKTLLKNEASNRPLYLYDTFEGMTEPTDADVSVTGRDARESFVEKKTGSNASDWCRAPIDEVSHAIASTGYDMNQVHLIKGMVEETIPKQMPDQIAILRLDTDWYESTRHELEHLYPLLAPGGFLIIDDYGYWQGARRAVDEYLQSLDNPTFLHRVDNTCRLAIKAA